MLVYSGPPFTSASASELSITQSQEKCSAFESLSSASDMLAPIKIDLMNLIAPFFAMNVENVIYYMLYQKKTAIGLKIFEL